MDAIWDGNGNIGKRYRRQDNWYATPVVVDFQTEDDTVTVREQAIHGKTVNIKDRIK